ncbi:MAG: ABC transporter ATP-binding protein [Candidatus Omnitrophica bacterium]|nr:ABC transporter ATP-binding protein [Candidatus Omnitrophota bacterium]
MALVEVKDIFKNYFLNKTSLEVLKGINLKINQGEFLVISGPSGSGKTTLLNIMGCMDKPSSGEVFIDGQKTINMTSDELADVRAQKIGFVFQNFNLFPVLSVIENVEYSLLFKPWSSIEKRKKAQEALSMVGLSEFARHKPLELSGGQQQRVAIARAIVREPLFVLADEPTANLDHKTGEGIIALMKKRNQQHKTTFIFSTHDQKIIDQADRVVKIWDGEIQL